VKYTFASEAKAGATGGNCRRYLEKCCSRCVIASCGFAKFSVGVRARVCLGTGTGNAHKSSNVR
jgi:hypothetical protein